MKNLVSGLALVLVGVVVTVPVRADDKVDPKPHIELAQSMVFTMKVALVGLEDLEDDEDVLAAAAIVSAQAETISKIAAQLGKLNKLNGKPPTSLQKYKRRADELGEEFKETLEGLKDELEENKIGQAARQELGKALDAFGKAMIAFAKHADKFGDTAEE